MNYLMLFLSVSLLALNFAVTKVYQKKFGISPAAGFKFNAYVGIFTAIIFLIINGFKLSFTPFSVLMSILTNGFAIIYTIIGFRIMKSGSMAQYTMFLMTGGMTVPYIWGLLFLDEKFSWLRTVGLIIIIAGIFLSNYSKEKTDIKQILLCLSVFFINGFVSVISKLHQIEETFKTVTTSDFVVLGGIMKFVIAATMFFVVSRRPEKNNEKAFEKSSGILKTTLIITAGSAVLSGASYMIQLWAAESLPSTVLFPFITGGSIVLSSLAGWLMFKDKLTRRTVLGIICCFAGTVLFL